MIYLGIDPGKTGALAALDDGGRVVRVFPVALATSASGRDEYDLPRICGLLRMHPAEDLFVTVEKLHPLPPKFNRGGKAVQFSGTIANFNRGLAHGWAWMLTALGIAHQLVASQTWQKAMLAGQPGDDTGQRSILAAKQLWPLQDLRRTERSRKDDDGISDALLLAEFGRRKHRGALAVGA